MVHLAIYGAAGQMGRRSVLLTLRDPDLKLVGAVDVATHSDIGSDAGVLAGIGPIGVPLATDLPEDTQVVVDFSVPDAVVNIVHRCVQRKLPLVIATTGFGHETEKEIRAAADSIPIVWSLNMSLAVSLTKHMAQTIAQALHNARIPTDVEIVETHGRFVTAAPSQTALEIGRRIAQRMGLTEHRLGRQGTTGPRDDHEIGYHAIRAGDDPGQYRILFGMMGERIELHVAATNRDSCARGALSAAKYVVNQPPGLYSVDDVLGLEA